MARIFLSYSRKDIFAALALKQWLVEQDPDLRDEIFMDLDPDTGIEAGTKWRNKLRQASSRCEFVLCLCSPAWQDSRECQRELEAAENNTKRVILAPLSDYPGIKSSEEEVRSSETEWQRVPLYGEHLQAPLTSIEVEYDGRREIVTLASTGLAKISSALRRPGSGADTFDWPLPKETRRNPYRGLCPFGEDDTGVFFGRNGEIHQSLTAVGRIRTKGRGGHVIRGQSGCGKTSFLHAGLIPRLRRKDRDFVVVGIVTAGRNPVSGDDGLAEIIRGAAAAFGLSRIPNRAELIDELLQDPANADRHLALIHAEATRRLLSVPLVADPPALVLAVDQADAIFATDAGSEHRVVAQIVTRYAREGTVDGIQVIPLLAVSDHAASPAGNGMGAVAEAIIDLKPISPQHFREVITGPASRRNSEHRRLDIDPVLVTELLSDFSAGADPLPLLSLTLARLWQEYGSDDDLRCDEYERMGGLGGTVSHEIAELLDETAGDRTHQLGLLREAFIPHLATIDPDTGEAVARRASGQDIPEASRPLIQAFVDRRLLVRRPDGSIELAAYGMLTGWQDLHKWLGDLRPALAEAETLSRQAQSWARAGQDKELLLEGRRLEVANATLKGPFAEWVSSARPFVEQSQRQAAEKRSKAAKNRTLIRTGAIVVIVALVFGTLTFIQWRESARIARALELVTQAEQMLDGSIPGGDVLAMQLLLAANNLGVKDVEGVAAQRNDLVKIMEIPPDSKGNVVGINDIAVSPDGTLIAAATAGRQVVLWDSRTGRQTTTLDVDSNGTVRAVAFSATGDLIAAGGDDGKLRVWRTKDGSPQPFSDTPSQMITSVAFSPTGNTVAAGTADGVLRLWDAHTGDLRAEPEVVAEKKAVRSVAFNPDPKLVRSEPGADGTNEVRDIVLTGDDLGRVQLWDGLTALPESSPITVDETSSVSSVAFGVSVNEDGEKYRLAAGMLDGRIHVLDGTTFAHDGPAFAAHPGFVQKLAFSPGGTRIVSGGSDNSVRVWNAATHQSIGDPLLGHHGAVSSVAFDPEGTRIISGAQDGSVRIWDAITALPIPADQGAEVRSVAFRPAVPAADSPDDGQIATGGTDSTVKLWHPVTGAPMGQLGYPTEDLQDSINALAYRPDGKRLVTGSRLGYLEIWDLEALPADGSVAAEPAVRARTKGGARISSVAFSPDGMTIATGQWDGSVQLWDAETLAAQQQDEVLPYQVWSVAFSPAGNLVASGSGAAIDSNSDDPHEIRLWTASNMAADRSPLTEQSDSIIYSLSFNGTGDVIASGSADGTIQLWDVATSAPIGQPLSGDQNVVMALDSAHRGPLLASGSADGKVRLWDMATRALVGIPISAHRGWVHDVAFSPQDDRIVSGGADGKVRLWPVIQNVTTAICDRIGASMSKDQWDKFVAAGKTTDRLALPYGDLCPQETAPG